MTRKDPTKAYPENYQIVRYVNGDSFEGFHKGNHIGAGGSVLSYNAMGVDVPDHWRTFDRERHHIIIERMKNNPEVELLLTRGYQDYVRQCVETPKIREQIAKEIEELYSQLSKVGFFGRIALKYKIWKQKSKLRNLPWFPDAREYINSRPKYPVEHKIITE